MLLEELAINIGLHNIPDLKKIINLNFIKLNSYSDYEDYNEEYDEDHLTVNPILALLGSKPTTPKPTTHNPNDDIYITSKKPKPTTIKTSTVQTSPKATETQATEKVTEKIESTTTEAPIVIGMNETSHQIDTFKVDIDEGDIQAHYPHSKPSTIYLLKPQGNGGTNITQIDYDDIPVQVVFDPASRTRQNSYQQQFKKQNGRHATSNFNKRPNVEIIGDHSGRKNVKIIDGERIRPFVKICGQGEYKDQQGRCRVRRSGSSAM